MNFLGDPRCSGTFLDLPKHFLRFLTFSMRSSDHPFNKCLVTISQGRRFPLVDAKFCFPEANVWLAGGKHSASRRQALASRRQTAASQKREFASRSPRLPPGTCSKRRLLERRSDDPLSFDRRSPANAPQALFQHLAERPDAALTVRGELSAPHLHARGGAPTARRVRAISARACSVGKDGLFC